MTFTSMDIVQENAALCRMFADNSPFDLIAWENKEFSPPTPPADHCQFSILTGEDKQISMGIPSENTIRTTGIVSVNTFTVLGKGKDSALSLAKTILEIFSRKTVDSIQLQDGKITTIGNAGEGYYQINISIPFTRDSFG